jgi:gas vesicle protein
MGEYNKLRSHDVEEYQEIPDKTTGRDFSIGLFFGLVAGTIGGLLLAPKSGDALRDDIQNQADKLTKTFTPEEPDEEMVQLKKEADSVTDNLRKKLNDSSVEDLQNDTVDSDEFTETGIENSDETVHNTQLNAEDEVKESSSNENTVDMKKYVGSSDKDKSE